MRVACSEKIAKLTPAPSHVAPRGKGEPGHERTGTEYDRCEEANRTRRAPFAPLAPSDLSYPVSVPSLLWLRRVATLLDARFRIPGTNVRFGLDPILSLVPGVGDLASPAFAVALLVHAVYLGVPRVIMVRMLVNSLIDALIGAIPIAGLVGDVFFRANLRNLALVERYSKPGVVPTRADRVFVLVAAGVFGLILLIPVAIAVWLTWLVWTSLTR